MSSSSSSESCGWPPTLEKDRWMYLLCQQGEGVAGSRIDDNFRAVDTIFHQWFGNEPNGGVVWDDLRIAASATKAGAREPTFTQWFSDGLGSQGVFLWGFPDGNSANERELFFNVQIPHAYKLGTDLHAHVHWTPAANSAAGQVVNWGLEYTIANMGDVFGNTEIISANTVIPADSSLVADKHYITPLGAIDGSGIDSVSTMLICRIFRDCSGALGTDSYTDAAGLLEIDFHYQIDSGGSRTEFAK